MRNRPYSRLLPVATIRRPVRIAGVGLHLDDAVVHGVQLGATSRVVLPQQDRLVVDELATVRVDNLPSKVFVLEQIEEVQAHRILQVACVLGFLPVQQILQIVDESRILEESTLGDD